MSDVSANTEKFGNGNGGGALGPKLTELRESLGLSVEELAERCDSDPAVIRGLEAGDIAPSMSPLIKITRALGVRLGTLLDDAESLGPVVTRSNEYTKSARLHGLRTKSDAGELTFHALAEGKASRHMEPVFITLEPSESLEHTLTPHEGEEFMFVLDGPLEIEYGKEIYVLEPGDSIYYDCIVPHQVRSHDGQRCSFVACMYTPA
jgi:transcriptional regulator with XRE-family HTH domain